LSGKGRAKIPNAFGVHTVRYVWILEISRKIANFFLDQGIFRKSSTTWRKDVAARNKVKFGHLGKYDHLV